MQKVTKRSVKTGAPPGTLIHIGEKRSSEVTITSIRYNEDRVVSDEIDEIRPDLLQGSDKINWLNIDGLHDIDLLRKIGNLYGLHILTLEDILNTEQRPKIEDFQEYYYIVLKMLTYDKENREVRQEQVSMVIKDNTVLTFQEKPGDVFDPVRNRINTNDSRLRRYGSDFLMYSLMDAIVDNYFIILENIGDEIELIEESILSDPNSNVMKKLYLLKRSVLLLRKTVWPLREIVAFLERTDTRTVTEGTKIFFRDLYDHTIQIIDNIESLRDLVAAMVDIYLSTISNRMNSVMKVLTMIATIFIPLTFIAGVYGMNFANMPELEWRYGYPLILLIMFLISLFMLYLFKRKKWL